MGISHTHFSSKHSFGMKSFLHSHPACMQQHAPFPVTCEIESNMTRSRSFASPLMGRTWTYFWVVSLVSRESEARDWHNPVERRKQSASILNAPPSRWVCSLAVAVVVLKRLCVHVQFLPMCKSCAAWCVHRVALGERDFCGVMLCAVMGTLPAL